MIDINLGENSYKIVFTKDFEIPSKNFVAVISEKVQRLYKFDFENIFILKDGEKEKNFKNYHKILEFCSKRDLKRDGAIVAIGGGVVGDIAGFAASTYLRGVDFIQIPTTLLACVDSSVGGKTAVNTNFGKNLVGTFYQPKAVFINTDFLKTLSERDFKTGLGEVLKYGFIEKSCLCEEEFNLLNFLDNNSKKILERDEKTLEKIIGICIKLKKSVVEKDEKESGLRRVLNFGHTYAHAVEKLTNYKFTHGECVAAGIEFAFELALKENLIDKNYLFYMQEVMKKFDFKPVSKFSPKKLLPVMKYDKKSNSDGISFILPSDFLTVKEVIYPITIF